MSTPSTRDLLKRLQKIEESERKTLKEESGPEATSIQSGEEVKITSKDDHSGQVKHDRKQGAENAEDSYDGSDKEVETKTGNKRDSGSEKAEEEYTGSKEPVSDDFKHSKGSNSSVAAAQDADKDFSNYRSKIRAAMRGGLVTPIDKPEFKGNQGLNK
jgi:hypothetical protein